MTVGRRWTQTTSDVANGTDEPGVRAAGGRAGGLRGAFLRLRRQSLWVARGSGDGVCFRPSGAECRQPRPGNARTRILHVCFVSHPSLAVISRFNGPAESRLPWSRKPTECLGSWASLSSETRRAAPAVAEGRSHLSVVRALILGTRERRPFSPREVGRPARAAFTGDVTTLSARRCVSVRAELIYAFPCSPRGSS